MKDSIKRLSCSVIVALLLCCPSLLNAKSVVEDGGKKLLMTVDGASWALFKVGDKHARLLLVDPGYIDPQERVVKIKLKNTMPLSVTDILSGEEFSVKNGELIVKVPAGSMRFIDFEYFN